MEKSLCAQKTLAGKYQKNVPPRASPAEGTFRKNQKKNVFLPGMPKVIRVAI
jgi:hypothetical protein